MKKIIIISVFLLTAIPQLLFSQTVKDVSKRGTTAAPFLNISQGARAAGMGSAFVAVADDPSTIYWNVAGLARLENHGATFDHTLWFADIGYNFGSVSFNLGDFGVLGASFISSDVEEMSVTTITEPNGTGESFTVTDMAFSIGWAFNLTDNFSIGFNPKVVYQGIWKMSDYAFAIDFGVLYNTPFDGITLGMSISNFGSKMSLSGTSAIVLYDDDLESTGNNGRIPAELDMESWDLPLGFKVGLAYRPFKVGEHDIILSIDASHPNNNYESLNIGGEYTFNDIFSIRGGYKSLFLDGSEESFSLGAGFKQKLLDNVSIKFDYAYADFGRLENIQKFSIGVFF